MSKDKIKFKIYLTSNFFGREDYYYNNEKEAKKGFERLLKSCKKYYAADKIQRELTLVIGE